MSDQLNQQHITPAQENEVPTAGTPVVETASPTVDTTQQQQPSTTVAGQYPNAEVPHEDRSEPTNDISQPITEDERSTPFLGELENSSQPESYNQLEPVHWTASEYIAHKKGFSWFLAYGAIVVVILALLFFITGGDLFTSLSIIILAIIFGVYAGRQPQEQEYTIDERGVSIGAKTYSYDVLRSFSIIDEGPLSSIVFMPMKRFMPLVSIYYDPADEDKIIAYLSSVMPMEYRKHDNIDKLMHKIKF